jgi:hypothetical protein
MSSDDCFKTMEYWLYSIQARAPESSIILVGTHLEINDQQVPIQIIKKFPQVIIQKNILHIINN